ncbi:MAG: Holliday junction branch migration protein RuvA [Microbacteriaceae bacterium]|nr:Holliday junction branch migration protein RuvA [Microbacteriaceae bacterium]
MIAALQGRVRAKGAGYVVVAVGGVGFRAEVPSDVAGHAHIGDEIDLHTQMVVRDDAITLFGFAEAADLEMFNLLLGVNGVGPRSALGVLSVLSPGEIAAAVAAEDEKPFKAVSGIGPKSAKLIVVSLAGKLDHVQQSSNAGVRFEAGASPDSRQAVQEQLVLALTGLGWHEKDVTPLAAELVAAESERPLEQLLPLALGQLHKNGGKR